MSTIYDADPTTYAPRGDDITTVSAWSSSPLGDPADRAGYSAYRADVPPDPITPAARPWSISKGALVGGLIGTIGVSAAVGMALFGDWGQPVPNDFSRPKAQWPWRTGKPVDFQVYTKGGLNLLTCYKPRK